MTKATHTPAPWSFHRETPDSEWVLVTDPNGNIVANVNSESGPDIPPLVSTKMPQSANAHLIRTAPELYNLLHCILMQHRTGGAYSCHGGVSLSKSMDAHIEGLLAKARGE